MKKLRFIISLLPVCLFFAAGPAHAAKMPTVDICHFDADEGIYQKLSVSGNAQQPHLNHGDVLPGVDNGDALPDLDDDCFAIIVPDPIARAYIDVNQDGAYDATEDVDIAVLLDTDGTPGLSVGDTIELGQYPKDFNPCPDMTIDSCDLGTFNNTPQTVTRLGSPGSTCQIDVDSNEELALCIREGERETLLFRAIFRDTDVIFIDAGLASNPFFDADQILVEEDPAWLASAAVPIDFDDFASALTNDHFINVIIY